MESEQNSFRHCHFSKKRVSSVPLVMDFYFFYEMTRNQLSDRIRKLCWGALSLKIYKIAPVFYVFRSAGPLACDRLCPAGECLSSSGLSVSLKDTQTWGVRDQDEGRWELGEGWREDGERNEEGVLVVRREASDQQPPPPPCRITALSVHPAVQHPVSQPCLVPLSHLILLEVLD